MKLTTEQKKEIADQQSQKNVTKKGNVTRIRKDS